LIRATVNGLHLVADTELLGRMTIMIGLGDPLVVTAHVATTVNDHLVDDRMTIMAAETTDAGHHHETPMDHPRPRDENRTAMILTTEAHPHHPEAMAPIPMHEVVIRTVVGHGLRQEQAMEAAMQLNMTEGDTGEFPVSIHDSAWMASVESQFLELIHIDRVRRGNIIAERTPSGRRSIWCRTPTSYRAGTWAGNFSRMANFCTRLDGGLVSVIRVGGAVGSDSKWADILFCCYTSKVIRVWQHVVHTFTTSPDWGRRPEAGSPYDHVALGMQGLV
jgi:hypothetical protein